MGSIPAAGEENCPNMLSLVSFAGMTLNKCAVLQNRTLTGGPLCRESHPLCWLKNPTVVYMITCRLSSCKTGLYNVRLLIILQREGVAVCIEEDFIPLFIFWEVCLNLSLLKAKAIWTVTGKMNQLKRRKNGKMNQLKRKNIFIFHTH